MQFAYAGRALAGKLAACNPLNTSSSLLTVLPSIPTLSAFIPTSLPSSPPSRLLLFPPDRLLLLPPYCAISNLSFNCHTLRLSYTIPPFGAQGVPERHELCGEPLIQDVLDGGVRHHDQSREDTLHVCRLVAVGAHGLRGSCRSGMARDTEAHTASVCMSVNECVEYIIVYECTRVY